jgi:two-component system, NtrC family, nitrogen regulation sensor histidine kinase NtrY
MRREKEIKSKIAYKKFSIYLAIAALIFSIATYYAVGNADFIKEHPYSIVLLSTVDFILLVVLVILTSRKILSLWIQRREESKGGSRLRKRILVMFCLLSSIPAILIAVFSTIFFQFVIDSWFDKRVSMALDKSVVVAESYLKEHVDAIKIRAKAMALEVDNNVVRYHLVDNKELFTKVVSSLVDLNALSEAVVFQNNSPVVRSRFGASLSLEIFPSEYYHHASSGGVVVIKDTPNKIRAMASLHSIPNSFIVVGKFIDDKVVDHVKQSQGAATKYNNLKTTILETQIRFTFLFFMVAMLLLLASIYVGISFAGNIVNPIAKLVNATRKVQEGDFSAQVQEGPEDDEIGNLSRAFNVMTKRISEQQDKLLSAYNEINDKRKFSEAVLSGVSTGIVVLEPDLKISLVNSAAAKLLHVTKRDARKKLLSAILPESCEFIQQLSRGKSKSISTEISVRKGYKVLTLLMKVVKEKAKGGATGYIITLDDMTELAHAQRYAAWSDVARRIAHEVKNPLTPIHLGAERLNRKYKNEVSDPETFGKYTATIIKHVSDISRIIEEFSRFARMPKAELERHDISRLIAEIVFSRKCASNNIEFKTSIANSVRVYCDQTQVNQFLTNILKNAEESIEAKGRKSKKVGTISISLKKEKDSAVIVIKDNGMGFNEETIEKIAEPYFTTRDQGTGLGLAIVKKIVDDHNGKLIMKNGQDGQAVVTIYLPLA